MRLTFDEKKRRKKTVYQITNLMRKQKDNTRVSFVGGVGGHGEDGGERREREGTMKMDET